MVGRPAWHGIAASAVAQSDGALASQSGQPELVAHFRHHLYAQLRRRWVAQPAGAIARRAAAVAYPADHFPYNANVGPPSGLARGAEHYCPCH